MNTNPVIVTTALIIDGVVLAAFLWIKASSDLLVVWLSLALMIMIFAGEKWFFKSRKELSDPNEEIS